MNAPMTEANPNFSKDEILELIPDDDDDIDGTNIVPYNIHNNKSNQRICNETNWISHLSKPLS